jgi:hypothetical protein
MEKAKRLAGPSKVRLREAAANVLRAKGFRMQPRKGKGIRPGARWRAKPSDGPAFEVAVRTGRGRSLGFSRLSDGSWRTLHSVHWVLCVVPAYKSPTTFVVLAFEAEKLSAWFNRALEVLEKADRAPALDVPIFIPLDQKSKKNVGHDVAGLKRAALWRETIDKENLADKVRRDELDELFDLLKQKIAEREGIDVGKVVLQVKYLK